MVSDGPIIEPKRLAQLMGIVRSPAESGDDSCPVRTTPRPRNQVPEEVTEGCAHDRRGRKAPPPINTRAWREKGARRTPLQREQRADEAAHRVADRQVPEGRVVPHLVVARELRRFHPGERDQPHVPTATVVVPVSRRRLPYGNQIGPGELEQFV